MNKNLLLFLLSVTVNFSGLVAMNTQGSAKAAFIAHPDGIIDDVRPKNYGATETSSVFVEQPLQSAAQQKKIDNQPSLCCKISDKQCCTLKQQQNCYKYCCVMAVLAHLSHPVGAATVVGYHVANAAMPISHHNVLNTVDPHAVVNAVDPITRS